MKYRYTLFLFLLILASCKKEGDNNPPINGGSPDADPVQYGIPYDGVPETNEIIMYEINLRAYSPTGDIQGIINRIDSIQALGINVIWLMPIHPVGELNSVNSPYCVMDYEKVNPEFGTLDDLRDLVEEAHEREMAVIIDWVANHTAWDNPWIYNTDWYTQVDGEIVPPPGTTALTDTPVSLATELGMDAYEFMVLVGE
ncbi:MAG: hypothetical protein JXK95_09725 [Bacteroidales bacterium]|nr:hypothetical protein [Bacteroidales bacterium]